MFEYNKWSKVVKNVNIDKYFDTKRVSNSNILCVFMVKPFRLH